MLQNGVPCKSRRSIGPYFIEKLALPLTPIGPLAEAAVLVPVVKALPIGKFRHVLNVFRRGGEDLARFGVSEEDLARRENSAAFCELMRFEVERARDWFRQGLPLIGKVDRELAIDLELFSRGGQEVLNAIERQRFAVLGRRPAISKSRKLALVARAAIGKLL